MSINLRIKEFYERKGFKSQKAFSDIIGVSDRLVSNYLLDKNEPSFEFLMKMIEAFKDLDARWLLTGERKDIEISNELDIETSKVLEEETPYDNPKPKTQNQKPTAPLSISELEYLKKAIEMLQIENFKLRERVEKLEQKK